MKVRKMPVVSNSPSGGDSVQTSPDSTSHEDTAMDTMEHDQQHPDNDSGDNVVPDSQSPEAQASGVKRTAPETSVNGSCDGVKRIKSGNGSDS